MMDSKHLSSTLKVPGCDIVITTEVHLVQALVERWSDTSMHVQAFGDDLIALVVGNFHAFLPHFRTRHLRCQRYRDEYPSSSEREQAKLAYLIDIVRHSSQQNLLARIVRLVEMCN